MNLKNLVKVPVAFLAIMLFASFDGKAQSMMPPPDPNFLLDSWSFNDTTWVSDFDDNPLNFTNLNNPPSFDGNAVQVDTNVSAYLQYSIVDDAVTNLTFPKGTVEFWVLPDWNSGMGPGDWGRLIEVGAYGTNSPSSWWSLYFSPDGTSITFSSETNGVYTNYLSYPISWDTNTWHLIDLTYLPFRSQLYIDGQLATNGTGSFYTPSADVISNGFFVGSDAMGEQQSRALMDDLATFNYTLSVYEISNDYAAGLQIMDGGGFHLDDGSPVPPGSGGGTGGTGGDSYTPPDYGSNLWVALLGMTNATVSLLESNTISDVLYELQGCTNLLSPNWVSYGFVSGSELTNCTPTIAPINKQGNLFLRLRSWQSVGGVPLWWFLAYFGQDTNVDANAFSPSGDGWTLLQCYQNGFNPTNWVTPPAPQGLTITSYNTNGIASLSWMLSAGPVLGYVVQTPTGTNIVGSGVDGFTDNSSSSSATYSISAIYSGGLSAWSPSVSVEDFLSQQSMGASSLQNVAFAAYVPGLENTYLVVGGIPTNAVTIELIYYDIDGIGPTLTLDVPVTQITNGVYQIPPSWFPASDDGLTYDYAPLVQTIDANDNVSSAQFMDGDSWASPYYDGRIAMKQDVTFLLREPNNNGPFSCDVGPPPWNLEENFIAPSNYVFAGLYDVSSPVDATTNDFDYFRPFEDNYFYRNFVFQQDDVNTNGYLTNGLLMAFGYVDTTLLTFSSPPEYQFELVPGETNIPSLLATNIAQFLVCYPFQLLDLDQTDNVCYDLASYGITYSTDWSSYNTAFTMAENVPNYFGLPYQAANIEYTPQDGEGNPLQAEPYTLNAGGSLSLFAAFYYLPYVYPQAAQPLFQTAGYNFWNTSPSQYYETTGAPTYFGYNGSPLPGDSNFAPTNNSDLLVTSIGEIGFQVASYTKLAVTNSLYSGVYAYVGQYLTSAYRIGSNGTVTTNSAGVVSPYGQFFATQPGRAALVTMPDPDTGQQGTGVVDVIALNVDANHDGTMDFSFTGPDFVSQNNPYRFWVNDDADSGDDFGDGVPLTNSPSADGVAFSSYSVNGQALYTIHGTRDLVDFFPVYINIGSLFQSNALSAGISYADTNWQFVLSQGDGALRFSYTSLTPLNYTNYLRDTLTASNLADALGATFSYNPNGRQFLTTVGNTGVALDPSFIANIATNNGGIILVEAWEPTTQPLVLTVYHGTNQVAQTQLALNISEVEQMFRHKNILLSPQPNQIPDRLTAADVPNEPPTNDKNFIFVHGYNVNTTQARGWDSDYFKRLYWSGSHAKFYGVTWESADSQKADAVTINLQTNIVNSFNTASLLNSFLNSLSGTNIVAAHSLGNMLVLGTLNDYSNQNINTYFMVDAAVAIEAIDGSASPSPDMYPSAWTGYDGNLLASGWHNLWPTNDGRSTLTWNSRLANLQNTAVYNFYSSGEEVLRDYPTNPPTGYAAIAADEAGYAAEGETGQYTWAWQEKLKGLLPANFLLSSDHGGWQFNEAYETNITVGGSSYWEPMSPAAAAELTTTELQTNAFFNFAAGGVFLFNNDLALETSSGSSYAQTNRNRIISDTIPCLTLPVGANPVPSFDDAQNLDMQLNYENGWPADRGAAAYPAGTPAAGEWHHSDNRAVAYTFTYKLFNKMVTVGNLQ
jgi:hypothetical protein